MELDVINLISNVGFPIVAFLLMYRLVNGALRENTEAIKNLHNLIELKLLK